MADDATYDDATYADATYATNADELTQVDYIRGKGHGILSILFSSCAGDPKGSVHRAWGITLLFIVLFFAMAFVEGELWRRLDLSRGSIHHMFRVAFVALFCLQSIFWHILLLSFPMP